MQYAVYLAGSLDPHPQKHAGADGQKESGLRGCCHQTGGV
jgi:hypothetical protein